MGNIMVRSGGLVHQVAGCFECHGSNGQWFAKNAQAVAAKHAQKYGHHTWCELGLTYHYFGGGEAQRTR
jgi:hypothetical protein